MLSLDVRYVQEGERASHCTEAIRCRLCEELCTGVGGGQVYDGSAPSHVQVWHSASTAEIHCPMTRESLVSTNVSEGPARK